MFLKLYTVLDTKTGSHSPPMAMQLDPMAVRTIINAAENSDLGRFPNDYCLLRIGEFDDQTAQVLSSPPVNLGTVSALLAAHRNANG